LENSKKTHPFLNWASAKIASQVLEFGSKSYGIDHQHHVLRLAQKFQQNSNISAYTQDLHNFAR
jgi:hypothetical protein